MQELNIITINSGVIDQQLVQRVSKVLADGGLVIFPTETTYGAGVDATNPAAVQKLLAYKARREGKPLSIAVTSEAMAETYVELNDQARRLYRQFLPGPVTVISRSLGQVAEGVASEFETLGVRIPDYPLVIEVVKILGRPITATSANASGAKRPYTIQDILDGLSTKQIGLIDLVVDAGELPHNQPSTVIDTTLSTPVVFRQGQVELGTNRDSADSVTVLTSANELETKNIAKRLLLKYWNQIKATGLVLGLNGSLGMGKTIFTKGIGEYLQISETISSPTYSYLEEYAFARQGFQGQLFHLDVWKINSEAELARLEIHTLLHPASIIVIEWYNQVEPWLQPVISQAGLPLVVVDFQEVDGQRQLRILEPQLLQDNHS